MQGIFPTICLANLGNAFVSTFIHCGYKYVIENLIALRTPHYIEPDQIRN